MKPSLDDLLEGVTLTLEQVILPELKEELLREHATLMLDVLRRLAEDWDRIGPGLYVENRDIEDALSAVLETAQAAATRHPRSELAVLEPHLRQILSERPYQDGEYPSVHTLIDWNTVLKEALVHIVETLEIPREASSDEVTEVDRMVRGVLRRMVQREIAAAPALPAGGAGRR